MKRNLTETEDCNRRFTLNEKGFSRTERIKRPSDIKRLFREGKKVNVQGAKLFFMENGLDFNRVGFPLPKGFKGAVKRNTSKRYSRESYRNFKAHLNNGFDILLLVYPSENDSFRTRCCQLQELCKKAGLVNEEFVD